VRRDDCGFEKWKNNMQLIELLDIRKTYHIGDVAVPALNGVSMAVARGEFIALMGTSGSGKSTLMNILGCLDRPTSGEYWLDGKEISRFSADKRAELRNHKIGFVFQNFNLLARTSALDNVTLPMAYNTENLPERLSRQRAAEMLDRVGLGDRIDHVPSQLSGGQQQRVAIARALINRPSILLADEPTGNLDSHTSGDILRLFEQLNEEQGITIILVTHDANIAHHSKRVIHISDGVIENGASKVQSQETTTAAGDTK
jgi:ABC-type lipoprotein export system ATPase subunit